MAPAIVDQTLVDVETTIGRGALSLVSVIAGASVGTYGILARGVFVARPIVFSTFVYFLARNAISSESDVTLALSGSVGVGAFGVFMAGVRASFALIDVSASSAITTVDEISVSTLSALVPYICV